MGRKPKCTVEEKIAAVEDYLNGTRSVSEIMTDLSIKSTRTEYYGAAEPPVRCGESHLSGLTEPPHFVY